MYETLAALFFAHVMADFVFQTAAMVRTKREPITLLLHSALVLATAMGALGQWSRWELWVLMAVHIAIDLVKALAGRDDLAAYLADQAAHLVSVLVLALLVPDLWQSGAWVHGPLGDASGWMPQCMTLIGGAVFVTLAGGFAVGKLMARFETPPLTEGLADGGRLIGILERGLIFVLLIAGQPAAIGFLIAAKSVMRFETASKEQKAAEYVIIGTLASFGWAIAVTICVIALGKGLPPLEIAPLRP